MPRRASLKAARSVGLTMIRDLIVLSTILSDLLYNLNFAFRQKLFVVYRVSSMGEHSRLRDSTYVFGNSVMVSQ
jgi:hypothetical protein